LYFCLKSQQITLKMGVDELFMAKKA
jgi:hypothetical protein